MVLMPPLALGRGKYVTVCKACGKLGGSCEMTNHSTVRVISSAMQSTWH